MESGALRTVGGVVFAIAAVLTGACAGQAQRRASAPLGEPAKPAWRVNLRPALGGAPQGNRARAPVRRAPLAQGRPGPYRPGWRATGGPRTSLWFLDHTTLAVTFVVRNPRWQPAERSRQAGRQALPYLLKALLLDAATGKIKNTATWPVDSREARIVAAHDGEFVTMAGRSLVLYSENLTELKKLEIPLVSGTPPGRGGDWEAHASPTGETILLTRPAAFRRGYLELGPTGDDRGFDTQIPWLWVKTDDLGVGLSWMGVQSGSVSLSDRSIAMARNQRDFGRSPTIEISSPAGEWRAVPSPERSWQEGAEPLVVTDDLLLVEDRGGMRLVRGNGEALFTEEYRSGDDGPCWPAGQWVGDGGKRFVLPFCKLSGYFPPLGLRGTPVLKRIVLYDAPFDGPSYTLDLRGPEVKGDWVDTALSPDGLKFAILNAGDTRHEPVELVQLPPLAGGH